MKLLYWIGVQLLLTTIFKKNLKKKIPRVCYKASVKNLADCSMLPFYLLIWCAIFPSELAGVGKDLEGVNQAALVN